MVWHKVFFFYKTFENASLFDTRCCIGAAARSGEDALLRAPGAPLFCSRISCSASDCRYPLGDIFGVQGLRVGLWCTKGDSEWFRGRALPLNHSLSPPPPPPPPPPLPFSNGAHRATELLPQLDALAVLSST